MRIKFITTDQIKKLSIEIFYQKHKKYYNTGLYSSIRLRVYRYVYFLKRWIMNKIQIIIKYRIYFHKIYKRLNTQIILKYYSKDTNYYTRLIKHI